MRAVRAVSIGFCVALVAVRKFVGEKKGEKKRKENEKPSQSNRHLTTRKRSDRYTIYDFLIV
jgi:hypothetical protein